LHAAQRGLFPPVQLHHWRDTLLAQKGGVAQTGQEQRRMCGGQPPERRQIQVVVMVVTYEYQIDGRELLESQPRRMHALRTSPLHRAGAFGIHRIGEHIKSRQLDQEGHMIDEGERDFAGRQRRRQRRHAFILAPSRPFHGVARKLPAQQIHQRAASRSARIEEVPAIEMITDGTVKTGAAAHRLRQPDQFGNQLTATSPAR
jgi:hypothetical protein